MWVPTFSDAYNLMTLEVMMEKYGHCDYQEPWWVCHECVTRRHFFSSLPRSPPLQKARALYACKAEHGSELSFIAGTIFENGKIQTSFVVLFLLF